jgi:precorrin-3B synthase
VTAAPLIQGWCPGALRPMASGDGLVVRVRPHAGRLSPAQAAGIAAAARSHGNGLIDLSARGNVQLRGVRPETHAPLIADLSVLGLIDRDLAGETRRNITVSPFANADALALALEEALTAAPDGLPGKFGFALDVAASRWLDAVPGDIRIERGAAGRLILRVDGLPTGRPVTPADAPALAVDLAQWFVATGGVTEGRGRMAALIARGARPPESLTGTEPPATQMPRPAPGLHAAGALVALAFGQMQAATLEALATAGHDLRLTPWRMVLLEGAVTLPAIAGLITDPQDPLLRVIACTGAPACPQALAPTRPLALQLAPLVPQDGILPVSGCATSAGFAVIRNGRASDPGPILAPVDLPTLLTGAP